jgi:hypothetical protein
MAQKTYYFRLLPQKIICLYTIASVPKVLCEIYQIIHPSAQRYPSNPGIFLCFT